MLSDAPVEAAYDAGRSSILGSAWSSVCAVWIPGPNGSWRSIPSAASSIVSRGTPRPDASTARPVIRPAGGVLVIALDTPVDPPEAVDAFFATDNEAAGRSIGEYAAAKADGTSRSEVIRDAVERDMSAAFT